MSCCADPRAVVADPGELAARGGSLAQDPAADLTFSVVGLHCAGCISSIERAVAALPDGVRARVNFTRSTVTLSSPRPFDPGAAIGAMRDLGYVIRPLAQESEVDEEGRALIRALAVAGFGAMNVMLLSVAVWAGADGEMRQVLNWFSALVALPALTYAARPFVRSAVAALRCGTLNMDVPISLAIVLAAGLSLAKTVEGTGETYYDAAVTLTFFLLAGRVVAHTTKERARHSLSRLAALRPRTARLVAADGSCEPIAVDKVVPGMRLEVAAGGRVPVDATLASPAAARFDASLVTGESEPVSVRAGEEIGAGLLALDGPLSLTALRPQSDSLLSRLSALQREAEAVRPPLARIADRAARVYAPAVHLVALVTFLAWWAAGAGAGEALTTAIVVLIITCPCALGLAVPIVHAAAGDELFRRGLVIKDGTALERLRSVDALVLDKTGTLTEPIPDPDQVVADCVLAEAAALARHSTHPVSRAVERAAANRALQLPKASDVQELEGRGVSARIAGRRVFLGRGAPPWPAPPPQTGTLPGLALHREGEAGRPIAVREDVREGAAQLIALAKREGLRVTILSGDDALVVERVAGALEVEDWIAQAVPGGKVRHLAERGEAGERILMVGDGLNDGPALAAAHVSVAVCNASDLAQAAADIVMTGDRIDSVMEALKIAKRAHRLTLENIGLSALYNLFAIPVAVAGFATPLLAAVVMSTSSLLVVANAQRIRRSS